MRQVGWAHGITVTGTALAAVAAIGGLWAQAVTSYWTQQTAEDQLSQSKDESMRKVRDQASKVTYWGGGGSAFEWGGTGTLPSSGEGSSALHVLNRSPDPIPLANIAIHITQKDSPDTGVLSTETWVVSLSNIPPCTHIEYPESALQLGFISDGSPSTLSDTIGVWSPVSMHFVDTRGKEWNRTRTSLKEGSTPHVISKPISLHNYIVGTDAQTHKADSCTDGN
jgi:hypothetical protein